MIPRVLPLAGVAAFVMAFAGCAGVSESTDSSSGGSGTTASQEPARAESSASRSASTTESKRSEASSSGVASTKSDPDGPRSSWRAERDNQREARTASSGGNTDNARLLEQLNDASRELAALRAANAKLRAAAPAASSSASASRNDATDDKLAMSLKSYAQFKQEMANLLTDLERLRKENAALKSAGDQTEQARSTLARLEAELRSEKKSRAEAERTVAQLREQLRTIARALASAGLSVEKLAANADNSGR